MQEYFPTVSIQIPCYNQAAFILRAVKSALAQDYPHLEVVVCDDKSPDETYTLVSSIKHPKLKCHQNEKNLGRVGNYRHLLYDLVQGEWVVNLDGDDWFTDSGFISRAVHQIKQYQDVVFYHANQSRLGLIKKLIPYQQLDAHSLLLNGIDYLRHHHQVKMFHHLSTVYNRDLALQCGFYQSDSLNADFVSVMKLCPLGKIIQADYRIGEWNLNDASASMKYTRANEQQKNQRALQTLCDHLKSNGAKDAESIYNKLVQLQNYYVFQAEVLFSSFKDAIRILVKNASFSPDFLRILIHFLIKRILRYR
ncbi:MAG: glycosyltransferase family 2 protein [Chitinophagaceae bacterium]|nr:glycosyltransferase family 2 protein [Chitinophagaceae bacterium]